MAELDLELLASIASGGLGRWVQDAAGQSVYVKSDDCIGCLRDLQRFFRHDDPEARPAFFAVSKYNFARSDLVPLITAYPDDYDVVYNALKVATFLTMPSTEPLVTTNRAAQEAHMQAVREAFLARDALAAVVGMLAEPLGRHPRMDERDAALVQLVVAFLKNLVAVPESPAGAAPGAGAAGAAAAHEAAARIKGGLLDRLFSDNVLDLLLLLAQHANQRPFKGEAPVLVETFMHLFAGVDPQALLDAPAALEAAREARRKEGEARAAAAAKAAAAKRAAAAAAQRAAPPPPGGQPAAAGSTRRGAAAARAAVANTAHLPRLPALPGGVGPAPPGARAFVPRHVAQAAPSRHAHSGAVYVRRHSDHAANVVVRHNPHRAELPRLPAVTDAKKAPAQRKDAAAGGAVAGGAAGGVVGGAKRAGARLGPELLVRLNDFMQRFLEEAYDILMGQVFKELQPGLGISRLGEPEFLAFVKLATYCTRYVRLREERKLQQKLEAEKAQAAGEGQAAGGQTAAAGSGSKSPAGAGADPQQEQQQQQQQGAGTVSGSPQQPAGSAQQGQQQSPRAAAGSEAEEDEPASPFAAISATMGWDCFHWVIMLWIMLSNIEAKTAKQKDHADKNWDLQHASVPLLKEMLLTLDLARVAGPPADRRAADRLQRRLLHDDLKESGLLPVLARLIRGYNFRFQPRWHGVDLVESLHVVLGMLDRLSAAEPGGFRVKAKARPAGGGRRKKAAATPGGGEGEDGAGAADESPRPGGEAGGSPGAASDGGGAEAAARVGRSGDPLDDDDDFGERRRPATREVAFEAAKRIRQEVAHPIILHFYAWLLQGYRTNAPFTNHAILSFFRRIAEPRQLNLEPMLYQLSILRLFEAMLSDPAIRRQPEFVGLLAFARGVTRNLMARLVPDLSDVRRRAGETEANLEARFAAAGGAPEGQQQAGEEDGEVDSAEQEARRQRRMAQAELKAREAASALLFAELCFWKGPGVAEDVRNEYNWRGLVDPAEHKRRGGRRGRGTALGDDDGSEGEGQLGFASYRRRGAFTAEQAEQLRAAFERCNGRRDCLAALVAELGGAFKRAAISRQLKAMGLRRGKLTEGQEDKVRGWYEELRGRLDCFQVLAERLDAGFTANQVKRLLRAMGLVSGRVRTIALTTAQAERLRGLWDEWMARTDRFERIAEGMGEGFTARKVKSQLRQLGLLPGARRKKDAAFDLLLTDDEEGGGERGSRGGSAGASPGSASDASDASGSESDGERSEGGSDSEDEDEAAAAGGFASAEEDFGGGSDSEGGEDGASRAARKAAGRHRALQRLQQKAKRPRAASPGLGERMGPGEGEESGDGDGLGGFASADEEVPGAADSEPAAAAAADSDGGRERDAAAAQPAKRRKQKRAAAVPSPASSDEEDAADSDDDAGFESAPESPAGSGGAAPAKRSKKQRPAAEAGSGRGRRRSKGGGASTPSGGKRKAAEAPAGPSSAQKRAALDLLRRKRLGGAPAGEADAAAAAAAAPATEPFGAWQEIEAVDEDGAAMDAENAAPAQQQQPAAAAAAKPAGGRRLLKKAGAAAAAPAPAAGGFDDLEDDV